MDSHEISGKGWLVVFESNAIKAVISSTTITHDRRDTKKLGIQRKWFRYYLLRDGEPLTALNGCKKLDAIGLVAWLRYWELIPTLDDAVRMKEEEVKLLAHRLEQGHWTSCEEISQLEQHCPSKNLQDQCRSQGFEKLLTIEQLEATNYFALGSELRVKALNDLVMSRELVERRAFFDGIERTPLSEEQARAVVCFDNRVQVLAAAGSGKTSVMVARAAYAVDRNIVPPDRVLLLAFNRAAASELQERIDSRFAAAGIPSEGVKASTFHAFGLELIGRATGKKPRLAPWLEQDDDLAQIVEIVGYLRDSSEDFRYNWDLYRLLFANAPTRLEVDSPDGYDRATRRTGYRTFSGVLVKSHGERLIADFLFINGIEFKYERPFSQDVADEFHSQYRPDFYYPSIDAWHEHWAVDRDGHPPKEFTGYAQEMLWKRKLHAESGTKLIETTWAEVMFEDGLKRLQERLTSLGVEFNWNPDKPIADAWAKPLKHEDLARLVRTFMCHVKSNSWSAQDLEHRLGLEMKGLNGFRTRLFLSCYWPIHDEWNRRLKVENSVDFEDMLVTAANLLEEGAVSVPYELIMVDEFQDSSQARARLVRGLLKSPGRFLLAVGDDWQSINRFAGADASIMKQFSEWFGRGPQLALTTTFRCSQNICDVARGFVSKNPIQFDKPMKSTAISPGRPVTVVLTDDEGGAIVEILNRLSAELVAAPPNSTGSDVATVKVLGRYWFKREVLPKGKWKGLDMTFATVHGSKGLESDFVIIPGVLTGTYGFPSTVADDPVLELAMPTPDTYPHAEERRLFYVALTRARRGVFILASQGQPSPFVVELLSDPKVIVETPNGQSVIVCPACKQGTLVERHGPYDPFLGCTNFPSCRYKNKVLCPDCRSGNLVRRRGPQGHFVGCSGYPTCSHTAQINIRHTS